MGDEMATAQLDKVGYWSEIKLEILTKYTAAYAQIMNKNPRLRCIYIDAFAGAGEHISRTSGMRIDGSPRVALEIGSCFKEFHFVEVDKNKAEMLRKLGAGRQDVFVHEEDCNAILATEIFPRARYEDYKRALCLLDPYGLHLNWRVTLAAGKAGSIEIFLNFPMMDMNRNVLWHNPEKVDEVQRDRMNAFWGDDSWREVAYSKERGLFGFVEEREPQNVVVHAFKERLKRVGGFKFVPDPMPMRNGRGAIIYYLFFAGPNETGAKVASEIFKKYRDRGV